MTNTMTMTQPSTRLRVNQKNIDVKWGDICFVDFGKNEGSEQNGIRPAIIIQNDKGNTYSPTTIVASITTQKKKHLPTHVVINPCQSGLKKISTIMFEQIRTIDKSRIVSKVGHIGMDRTEENIKKSLTVSFGMWYNL